MTFAKEFLGATKWLQFPVTFPPCEGGSQTHTFIFFPADSKVFA